jgi:hypothetical protein
MYEVEDFKKRVQELLDQQRVRNAKKFERMLVYFTAAADTDGLDRVDYTSGDEAIMYIKDDEEEASETRSQACVYTKIFTELYIKHTKHLRTDLEEFETTVIGKLSRKAGQFGHRNTKEDEDRLLAVGYLPSAAEWKQAVKVDKTVVKVTEFLKANLPSNQKEYVSSLRMKFQVDLKRAKMEQLQNMPYPKPMLKRQNGFLGFVYTITDEPLMMEVMNKSKEAYLQMIHKLQEKSLKRKIKSEPDFVGLPIKKEKTEALNS